MTNAELDAIAATNGTPTNHVERVVADLVAEVRRLQAARDALRAALEDLMRDQPQCPHADAPAVCRYCFARAALTAPIDQAAADELRALLEGKR